MWCTKMSGGPLLHLELLKKPKFCPLWRDCKLYPPTSTNSEVVLNHRAAQVGEASKVITSNLFWEMGV